MSNPLKTLYGVDITKEELVGILQKAELQSKGRVVGIEVELKNPHSLDKLIEIVSKVQQLPHVKEPKKVDLKFENKDTIEFNSTPFRLKELPDVLKKWRILENFGLTSTHLSYSGEPWEILNKIALTASPFATVWRSFWNQKHLDSYLQCWPHTRGIHILPREFGAVSIVSEHRYVMSAEIRYVGNQIEALGKILPFALKNYNRITDEDFKPLEPNNPYLSELKTEIAKKIKYPNYVKNVLAMVAWPFCITESSLFKKFLPQTFEYCVDNGDYLLEMYNSLADSYSKERQFMFKEPIKYPHLDAAKDVANYAAEMTINEVYRVIHF